MMIIMHQAERRGVAMLLVLISLGMATIIATSYLSSRDNSSAIGANVFDAAVARWTADSGIELTVAIMETQSDWRTAHSDGVLLDNYPISGGTLRIELLDLETLKAPDAHTRAVEITSIGTSNGHQQMATADAYVIDDATNVINVDLAEFAAFATSNVIMSDNALVAMWPEAPAKHLAERIALGTNGTALGTISLNGDAAIIDGSVFAGPGSSGSLVLNANSPEVDTKILNDQIPVFEPQSSEVMTPDDDSNTYAPYAPAGLAMLMTNQRWASVTPLAGTMIGTMGNIQVVSENDFNLTNSTAMIVDGQLKVVVFGDLNLSSSSYIEVKPGSSLTIFVGGDLNMNDAYIGNQRTAAERAAPDTTGHEGYMDANTIKIVSMSEDNSISLAAQSLVKGTIYAPSTNLTVQDNSALYGRATVQELTMTQNGSLFYDPALNDGTGYTNPDAEVFDFGGGGGILDSLLNAATSKLSLDTTVLNDLASDCGKAIMCDGTLHGTKSTDSVPVGPGDPTPRNILVSFSPTSFGSYIGNWEVSTVDGGTGGEFTYTKAKRTKEEMAIN